MIKLTSLFLPQVSSANVLAYSISSVTNMLSNNEPALTYRELSQFLRHEAIDLEDSTDISNTLSLFCINMFVQIVEEL